MVKAKPLPTNNSNADEISQAFYDALQSGDIEKVMACWADEDDIVCVYPDGPRILGAALIRASFEGMLSHGSLRIYPQKIYRVESMGGSVHSVLECVEVVTQDQGAKHSYMNVTNVYHKTAQGWRIVARHASLAAPDDLNELMQAANMLH